MYRTILVQLNCTIPSDIVSDVGAHLAERHNAYLIGIYNICRNNEEISNENITELQDHYFHDVEKAQKTFESIARARKLSFEWHYKELSPSESATEIVTQALTADLIVAGGRAANVLDQWCNPAVRIVMNAGRPVLLVPSEGEHPTIGNRITIAWNRTRESARAAFEALPFLKMAQSVRLFAVNGVETGALGPDDGLPAALERHGVRVETVAAETSRPVGEELLAELAESRSDLLIMGCYGRSRITEVILGGVTRHILGHIQIPVFLAH
jgi:nucleotide-binding universal stress UspA family protein